MADLIAAVLARGHTGSRARSGARLSCLHAALLRADLLGRRETKGAACQPMVTRRQ